MIFMMRKIMGLGLIACMGILLAITMPNSKAEASNKKDTFKADNTSISETSSNIHQDFEKGQFADVTLQQKQTVTLSPHNKAHSNKVEIKGIEPTVQLLGINEYESGEKVETYSLNYDIDVFENDQGDLTLENNSKSKDKLDPAEFQSDVFDVGISSIVNLSGRYSYKLVLSNMWNV